MKIVCISDTHNFSETIEIPSGDVLVHAGDFTGIGSWHEISAAWAWLESLPHAQKIVIAGNHDWGLVNPLVNMTRGSIVYLQDSEVEVNGLKFYGSPWQPEFGGWAFNLPRGEKLKAKWDKIPSDTDVLITHGPPGGILDTCPDRYSGAPVHVGCYELASSVLDRVKPKLHIFGHIHESYGQETIGGVRFVNASICTGSYAPTNAPIVIDL